MRVPIVLTLALLAGAAWADDPDAAALSLPGSEPQSAESAKAWQLFAEGAVGRSVVRTASLAEEARATEQLSIDLQIDAAPVAGLRAVLADRLDINWLHRFRQRSEVNTLKEAYLSWQPRDDAIVDLGRINEYSGVAIGYNPTDFFRHGALRSPVSVDPTVIKKNRQGSVMVRGQKLWEGASLTALYSPRLSRAPSSSAFDLDWGATNHHDRGLVIFSKRLSEDLNPQWLIYKDQGESPQFGMNLTRLITEAAVAYLEWSGGRSPSLSNEGLGPQSGRAFHQRLATGLTYTMSNKLSLTLEYEYNGAGLRAMEWAQLPRASLPAYLRLREAAKVAQEMPTRRAWLLHATWRDLLIPRLNLSAMVRRNIEDHSHLSWLELRYHASREELALQWQRNAGEWFTDYGGLPLRSAWQFSYRHYF